MNAAEEVKAVVLQRIIPPRELEDPKVAEWAGAFTARRLVVELARGARAAGQEIDLSTLVIKGSTHPDTGGVILTASVGTRGTV